MKSGESSPSVGRHEKHAARAAPASRPPRRPPRSPGWCPSRARRRRACPPSGWPRAAAVSRSAAKAARESSGVSASAGIVIRPAHRDALEAGQALQERVEVVRRDAVLGRVGGGVDLDQHVLRRRRARRRAARPRSPTPARARARRGRRASRTLRLCRWPMKSHVKRSPCAACLASSWSVRFSPARRMPAAWSAGRSSASTYLTAATISHVRGRAARRAARPRRRPPARPRRRRRCRRDRASTPPRGRR